ncbi:hypothetical protein GGG16DRAFT_114248 [Schizophyllum commune]
MRDSLAQHYPSTPHLANPSLATPSPPKPGMAVDSKTLCYEESKRTPCHNWERYQCGSVSDSAYYYYDCEQGIVTTDNIEDPLTCDKIRKLATIARYCSRNMVPHHEDFVWDVIVRKGQPTVMCSWVKGVQYKFSAMMNSVAKDSHENCLRTLAEFPRHQNLP